MQRTFILFAVFACSCSALSLSKRKTKGGDGHPEFWNEGSIPDRCNKGRKGWTEAGAEKASMAILAGVPKSGTTFLWDCMVKAMHPARVCGSDNSEYWAPEKCHGSKFLLPQLKPFVGKSKNGAVINTVENKESFYWGRSYSKAGLEAYLGPKVDLKAWSVGGMQKTTLIQRTCEDADTSGGDCTCWALGDEPRPGLRSLPFLLTPPKVGGVKFLEGTPNNLMNGRAPARIASEVPKEELNTLPVAVVLRDPGSRAYSEYAMFMWWYHTENNFTTIAKQKIDTFNQCKAEVEAEAADPDNVPAGAILNKCVPGEAMDILGSGLYVLGLQNWMDEGFDPSQFMIVSQNTLSALTAADVAPSKTGTVLKKIAKFMDVKWVSTKRAKLPEACQGRKIPFNIDKSKPMTAEEKAILVKPPTKDDENDDKQRYKAAIEKRGMLQEHKDLMKAFFDPYQKLLKQKLAEWKKQGMQFLMDETSEDFFPRD